MLKKIRYYLSLPWWRILYFWRLQNAEHPCFSVKYREETRYKATYSHRKNWLLYFYVHLTGEQVGVVRTKDTVPLHRGDTHYITLQYTSYKSEPYWTIV